MAGVLAFFHVLRRLLDIVERWSKWANARQIRRQTLDEVRLRSRILLDRARKARHFVERRAGDGERMHADDGYRRD